MIFEVLKCQYRIGNSLKNEYKWSKISLKNTQSAKRSRALTLLTIYEKLTKEDASLRFACNLALLLLKIWAFTWIYKINSLTLSIVWRCPLTISTHTLKIIMFCWHLKNFKNNFFSPIYNLKLITFTLHFLVSNRIMSLHNENKQKIKIE